MDSKKKLRSATRKGISGKSKTKDEAVKDSKVKELPLKDEIGRKVGHFDKSKQGEKSAVKKSAAGGRIATTKGKTNNDEQNVTEEREIKNFETPMKRKRGADGEIAQSFLLSVDRGSSRLRPRKEVPEFKMVELAYEDSVKIIGKRVKVYWSGSRKWFSGRVKAFDNKKLLHTIYYEDGDKEDLNLSQERFQLEVMPGENFTLKLEPRSVKNMKGTDDGMVFAEFLKNNSEEEGNSELKMDSEPIEKEAPKNALRRGSSKPKRKDAEVRKADNLAKKMDEDSIPEDVDKSKTVAVQAVEGGDKGVPEIVQAIPLSVDGGSSRLRPRKEVPEFKMVELPDEDNERIIGKRVKVYWPESRKWFPGRIKAFDNDKMLHTIYYEDGDKEDLNLSQERFQLEIMPVENFTLKLGPKSEKKMKGADDGMVIAEFLKNKSGEEGNSELKKDSEPIKKEAPNNALRRGSSKPKRKDAEAKTDVDTIPEDLDESKTDEVQEVEGGEKDHLKSTSLFDKITDFTEPSEAQGSRLESNSTRDMGSDGGEEGEKSVKGSSVKEGGDAQPRKKHVKSNKELAPTTSAAKLKHSKTQFKEDCNEEEKLPASVGFDCNQSEGEQYRMHLETNLDESLDLGFPKENHGAKSPTRVLSPGNGGMPQAAKSSQSNLNTGENELGFDDSKLSRVSSDDRSTGPEMMKDLSAGVEVDVHLLKVDEKVKGGEIKEGPIVNSGEKNDGEIYFSQAVSEGICKNSFHLQLRDSETLEEDPEILQGKLKSINKESAEDIPKELLEENQTSLSALAIQKNTVRRVRTKVEIQY